MANDSSSEADKDEKEKEFYRDFWSMDQVTLTKLMHAAYVLKVPKLLDRGCPKVADMVKG